MYVLKNAKHAKVKRDAQLVRTGTISMREHVRVMG